MFDMQAVDWSRPIDWKVCLGATKVTSDIYLCLDEPETVRKIEVAIAHKPTLLQKVKARLSSR